MSLFAKLALSYKTQIMKKALLLLFISVLLISCNSDRTYVDHQDLSPNLEWKSDLVLTFDVPVEDNSIAYDQSIAFRYATGFPYSHLLVRVTETSPSGATTENEYEIKVREQNGDYLGEPGLDIWDLEQVVEPGKKFEETGTYTYTVQHIMQNDPVQLAMELGMVLDKAK